MIGGGKRVLMVGDEGIVLYAESSKGIQREISIAWEVPNFEEQLTEALEAQNTSKSVVVLFDSSDQAYKNEEIPATIGALNRASFVKRKAMQLFPSHPIRAALEVKPTGKNNRRRPFENTPYLFAALPETDRLDRVGKSLLESGVLLSGFCLLPIESSSLVAELAKKVFRNEQNPSRWAAIIGQHETGARRQIFIKDGNLAFTRLTPTSESGISGAGWAEDVLRGINETLAYISRIGYNINDGLDLIVISGEIEKQFFDPKALRVTNFKCLTLAEALRAIGAKSYGLDKSNFADALHAAWTGKKNILKLPVRVPSIHRIMAPRLSARVASVALLLAALGALWFAFGDYQAYRETQEEIAQRENQKVMLDREYEQESKIFDALPVKPVTIKGTLAVKRQLETNTIPLAPTLHTLKKALGNDIFLEGIKYEHTPSSTLALSGGASAAGVFVPPPSPDDRGNVLINFKFGLPSNMKLEQKVMRAEALEKTLKETFPKYSVRIVTQFGRVERQGSLQGNLGVAASNQSTTVDDFAEFELEGPPL